MALSSLIYLPKANFSSTVLRIIQSVRFAVGVGKWPLDPGLHQDLSGIHKALLVKGRITAPCQLPLPVLAIVSIWNPFLLLSSTFSNRLTVGDIRPFSLPEQSVRPMVISMAFVTSFWSIFLTWRLIFSCGGNDISLGGCQMDLVSLVSIVRFTIVDFCLALSWTTSTVLPLCGTLQGVSVPHQTLWATKISSSAMLRLVITLKTQDATQHPHRAPPDNRTTETKQHLQPR